MDCSAIVLHKLLKDKDIEIWAKLKLAFIDSAYSSLYSAITRHYDTYSTIPSFEDLELSIRENSTAKTLAAVRLIDDTEIDSEVAINALIDQYTQSQTISLLDKFIDKLPIYDCAEIKENLSGIVLKLDEKTLTTEGVYSMSDILVFRNQEEQDNEKVYLGLNNTFDAIVGAARQELILIGGERGSGKSITCSNIMVNQYEAGNASVYFSIEMVASETLNRTISMLAKVPFLSLRNNSLTNEDLLKVVKVRAAMFEDADDLVMAFMKHKDKFKFEAELIRTKSLKQDNQMIIIDDRALSITSLDLHLGKLKARFKDKLKVCIVDYLNQMVVEGASQFDWQPQIIISKKLKELARKHEVLMLSPYQIDGAGQARFAKGILDAADVALIMKPDKETITFDTTKIRSGPSMIFTSPINWDTLRISPVPVDNPIPKETNKESKAKRNAKVEEPATDITPPWD